MKHRFAIYSLVPLLFLLFVLSQVSFGQPNLTLPEASPQATVMQTVGLTEITVTYHQPAVKGRPIWGELVPYNKVWRAGANENTTFKFSDPVQIGGKELPAGTFGFHMIPAENEWTLIFSTAYTAWGSYAYDQQEDALRLKVKPLTAGDFKERLLYYFEDATDSSVNAVMQWEKVKISFPIKIDLHAVVLKSIHNELKSLPQFFWQGWNQAATYCLQENVNLPEALTWVDRSISMNENYTNLSTKAGILKKMGQTAEATKLNEKAVTLATEAELNNLGYQYLNQGNTGKALEVFKQNITRHPQSWNTYDSLGEAYAKQGDKKLAVKNYTKALEMVKDEKQKQRIKEVLVGLK
jgi:tetratricopeptide (TPR) repeat protein